MRVAGRASLLLLSSAAALLVFAASAAAEGSGPPTNVRAVTVGGKPLDEAALGARTGKWAGLIPISYSYRWQLCDSSGESCVDIPGAHNQKYKLQHEDVGNTVRVIVAASNSEGEGTATSKATGIVQPAKPRKSKAPLITGPATDGKLMTAGTGLWKGTPPFTYAYQWMECIRLVCSPIPGAHQSSYRATTSEIGKQLRAVVTATNAVGSASGTSSGSKKIVAGPPVSVEAPAVSGLPVDGQALSAAAGAWAGTAPMTLSYQWLSCPLLSGECAPIFGATEPTYTAGPLDVGNAFEVVVTAWNAYGSASMTSPQTSAVSALLPSNLKLPSIGGIFTDGQLLSVLSGIWSGTGPIALSYQWQLCNAAGEACEDIKGAISDVLSLTSPLVGSTVRLVETATNAAGSVSATSEPTSAVAALLPSDISLPSITGSLLDGKLLSAVTGEWSGSGPLSFAYQWQQCNAAGEACKDLSGATATTLGLVSSLVGNTVRVVVTATNSGGSTSMASPASGLIGALLPGNTSLPSITGSLLDGQLLSAATGSWSGTAPLSYAYQWQQCNGKGESCKELTGATGTTLGLVSSLVGSTVKVVVTATNAGGSTQATSPASGLIGALLPGNTSLPSITGIVEDGKTLAGLAGSWSGTTPISYAYQWQQCNGSGTECKDIASEGGKETLGILSSLVKSTVRLVVTATNSGGSTQATSAATSPVLAALPLNVVQPTISGILKIGAKLLARHETWSGTTPITYAYQWQLCGVLGLVGECKNISGATGENLLLELLDVGLALRVGVTAHNERGVSETAYSKVTGLVQGLALSPTKGAAGINE